MDHVSPALIIMLTESSI